jgi:hypothetical protein
MSNRKPMDRLPDPRRKAGHSRRFRRGLRRLEDGATPTFDRFPGPCSPNDVIAFPDKMPASAHESLVDWRRFTLEVDPSLTCPCGSIRARSCRIP